MPNFGSVAAALRVLIETSVPNSMVWTEECDIAFQSLKNLLCSDPVLYSPDFKRTSIVQKNGVGAILSQVCEHSQEHPVSSYSRKLLPREQQYSTIEKECLAIK